MLWVLPVHFVAVLMQLHCTSGQTVMCPILTPPDSTNGAVILSSTTVGSEARYECFPGYTFNAPERRICQTDGTWSGVEPLCILIDCGRPSLLINGMITRHNSSSTFGSIANYTCQQGFVLDPSDDTSRMRMCQADGNWFGPDPTCEIIDCGRPNTFNNGVITRNATTFGSIATYMCSDGFVLNPDVNTTRMRMCQADGNWFGPDPTCEIIDCGHPSSITLGSVIFNTTIFGSIATYVCEEGYVLVPFDDTSRMRMCQADGNWFGPDPTCENITLIDCGAPSPLFNGVVTRRSDTTFGSIANYSCDEGFVLNPDDDTSRMRVCQADGTWFGPDPTCDRQCAVGVTSADSEFLCDESGGISAYMSNSVWYYFLFPLFAHL